MAVIWLMTLSAFCPAGADAAGALSAPPAASADQAQSGSARSSARTLTVLAFSEETLPPEDASPLASPGAGALPTNAALPPTSIASPAAADNSGGPNADWQQVPNGGTGAAPGPGAAPVPPSQAEEGTVASAPVPSAAASTAEGAAAEEGEPFGTSSLANSPPPALDVTNMTAAGLDPSQLPLTDEIKQADNPALAASLRATEQARKELADGRLDEAMRSLGPAVSIDPSNPYAYFYLGRVYSARRDFSQALTFFKRAEIGFGSNPQWLGATIGNEGTCYEELNQMSDAADAYRRALAAAPDNLMARAGYGRLGEPFPAANTAADPATPPEAVSDNPPTDESAAPPPEEAQPPPPPDAPPAEELPTSVQSAPDSSN